MQTCLLSVVFLTGVTIVASSLLSSEAVAETLIIYYQKKADGDRVERALSDIRSKSNRAINIVTVPANPFYDDRKLATNSVMCGDKASPDEVKRVVEQLMARGVEVRYVGPYARDETNSHRNTIDIRAVGDETFYTNYQPLKLNDINPSQLTCGYGEEKAGIFGRKN